MSPNLALLAFAVFITAGFVIERRGRRTPVSAASWLPVLWMAVCASRSIGQWLSVSNYKVMYASDADYIQANLSGSPVDRNVLTAMIVIGLVIIHKRGAFADVFQYNKTLLLFVLYLGVTILWSDATEASLKGWVRLFGHVVMAGLLMSEPYPLEALRTVFRRCAYLLVPLSFLLIKYFPNIGVLYFRKGELLWIGAAVMKNGLGHLALVFTFIIVWELLTKRSRNVGAKYYEILYDLIVVIMGLWLLRGPDGANSSAAIGSLIVGIAMLIGSRLPAMKVLFAKSGVFVIAFGVTFIILQSSFGVIEMIVAALGRDMTFTDRVPMWGVLVDMGLRSPIFGYGYSGFWTEDRMAAIALVAGEFREGHNGYLELFVEGGFVAIGLLLVMLVNVFRKIQRTALPVFDLGMLRLCFFVIVLIGNVTESAFARERDLLTFVFFMIAMTDERTQSGSQISAAPVSNPRPERTQALAKPVPSWHGGTRPAARRPVAPIQQSVEQLHSLRLGPTRPIGTLFK